MSAPVTLQQLTDQLDALEQQAAAEIAEAADAAALEQLRVGLLGKKGRISGVLGAMGKLPGEERPLVGQRANVLKTQVQSLLGERLQAVKQAAMAERIARESLDVTAPASGVPMGHRHPLITTTEEIVDLFLGLGYSVAEGPEVERDHYNFTALNIPEDHPARDMQDTFYLGGDLLMRTHTSPVQIRHLEENPPPVRIVAPGRVYRRDAVDATHSPVFHQVEVLAIDEGLDFSHLRGTVMAFLKAFFRRPAGALPGQLLPLHRALRRGGCAVAWPLAGGDGLRHGRSRCAGRAGPRSGALQRFCRGPWGGALLHGAPWH